MNAYRINGRFKMGGSWTPFTIEIVADSEEGAREKGLSIIGSRHRLKRPQVDIATIATITLEEATSSVVKYELGASR